jgi:rhamnose utilization protein RhaD (predicted bifunctional aldolase and dehydrogenase)
MTQQGGILLMDLSTLVKMSNTYGSNPAYVLAGGGNTSVKDDTTLYVKGSGTQLATIKAEEFVKMDRQSFPHILQA